MKTLVFKGAMVALIVVTLLLSALAGLAHADGKTKLAQEAADYILSRFGRQVAKEGAEKLAGKIESYAARHGDEFYTAVRRVGPQAFKLVEEAGEHAPQAVRMLSKYGEEGAVWLVSRPKAMSLISTHGEAAAAALVKHKGIAEPVIERLGQPAVRALEAVGPQNGRRLAMMASEGGELAAIGRTPEVLGVIGQYGDPALGFLWRHKGVLGSGVVLAAFVANPEPYLSGAKDITQVVAETTVKPLAELPATMAREAAGEVARDTSWTLVFIVAVLVLGGLAALRSWRKSRPGQRS